MTCSRSQQRFQHRPLRYARLGPDESLTRVRALLTATTQQLRVSQSLDHQRRLVALASRLAGLRAWGCFDLDQHHAAERWYAAAVDAAERAEAWSLGAWLLGAQSLIPWHRRDHRQAVTLIERGIYFAGRGADSTTTAWLHALHARGQASLGNLQKFEAAFAFAQETADYSNERDHRHGMDFNHGVLDLRYYSGTSRLLLKQPDKAATPLHGSLAALPQSHIKARAVLTLCLAEVAAQSNDLDQAVALASDALTIATHQPIMPILQQARRVRRRIPPHSSALLRQLDDNITMFAESLAAVAATAEP